MRSNPQLATSARESSNHPQMPLDSEWASSLTMNSPSTPLTARRSASVTALRTARASPPRRSRASTWPRARGTPRTRGRPLGPPRTRHVLLAHARRPIEALGVPRRRRRDRGRGEHAVRQQRGAGDGMRRAARAADRKKRSYPSASAMVATSVTQLATVRSGSRVDRPYPGREYVMWRRFRSRRPRRADPASRRPRVCRDGEQRPPVRRPGQSHFELPSVSGLYGNRARLPIAHGQTYPTVR